VLKNIVSTVRTARQETVADVVQIVLAERLRKE